MANFTKYSNYTPETGFSSVVFGANAPVLEVELNEMQQILNNKLGLLFKAWGNRVFSLSEDYYEINDNNVVIKNCAVLCNGVVLEINRASIDIEPNVSSGFIYVRVENETDVTGDTTLNSYGNNDGQVIDNLIKDGRTPVETSRRKLIKYSIIFSGDELTDTTDYKYVLVGNVIHDTETSLLGVSWNVCNPITSLDLKNFQGSSGLVKARIE